MTVLDSSAPTAPPPTSASHRIAREARHHALLLAAALVGGLNALEVSAGLVIELYLIALLAILVFPRRGLRQHASEMLRLTLFLIFFAPFLAFTYARAVHGEAAGSLAPAIAAVREIDLGALAVGALLCGLRLLMLIRTTRSPEARKIQWGRQGTVQMLTTFFGFLLQIVAMLALGALAVSLTEDLPGRWQHAGPVLLVVLARFAAAAMLSRIPEAELDDMASRSCG